MRKIAIAGIGAAVIGAAGVWAVAQQADRTAGDRLDDSLKEQAITRPQADEKPIGQAATEVVDGGVNWTAAKTELALTKRREIVAEQSSQQTGVRAAARTPGMRAAEASSFKYVVVSEVNTARLPVLAPDSPRINATMRVYSQGDSYSATAEVDDGVFMRMSGARKKIVVGDQKSARTRIASMRAEQKTLMSVDAPYLVSRSESSTDLSFSKFGAGYVLSLMCDEPSDVRCAEDAYIVALASNMTLLNAEGGGE